jgi:hypothetical protein
MQSLANCHSASVIRTTEYFLATKCIFNNKTKLNFGTGVTEHLISCHRKYFFVTGKHRERPTMQEQTDKLKKITTGNYYCNVLLDY